VIDADLSESQIQVDRETREIVGIGYFPGGGSDDILIVDITPEQRERIHTPGKKSLADDGEIIVLMPKQEPVVEQPDFGDYGALDNTSVIQAVTGLVQFAGNSDPTQKEMATALKHACRLLLYIGKTILKLKLV